MITRKKLFGLCFGLGDTPGDVEQKNGLLATAEHTEWVRLYDVAKFPEYMRALGLKIASTAWISGNKENDEASVKVLITAAKRGDVDLAIIGNEMLLRRACTPEHLIELIHRFKDAVPDTPVTTGEVEEFLLKYPQVMAACDIVGMHHYPYWCGIDINDAMADFDRRYREVVAQAQGKEVWVLETGWPSDGEVKKDAVASLKNARKYFRDFMQWAHLNNVKYFWFEAFDEQWKVRDEGPQGANWGMWTKPGAKRKY
ncbi:MAG: hypothetical protein UY70_C0001G0013 [Candidatus Kaiserbacteria bacterium GW2011_GWB1_52_6]|uniref:Endo-1,3-beta-glucanase btgC n=3 Tax=Candidatus Kaiseribacteriota TaxID=1752734 RepID=A0A0G1ZJK4_9BACT|nr:MAG: hypothetical protein UY67_C0007G0013 [Candidatus Kaiserbacteria bacterium GW2011_GWA2_52_12]KKW28177.1 MAG: hypothetical protein UY70_C0001G0013 [Candidatus Kaiserbacteria bacterium GW2011_GWB1_52_6]